ncbi:phosphoinositide 3-kinase regulatory subunit 6 isoform X3 [Antennarius striatus]|uniref:phosphoinositide 3-kinase regulatory subunit 6 isoform X3 n=1 Tax=Antennarius striatus TaxID=241820 RepID=UPI0035B3F091
MSSMEPTAGDCPTVSEEALYQNIKVFLDSKSDMDSCFKKGMLRWSLHKKVQNSPGSSFSLVRVLISELEKAEESDSRHSFIPLLHTLMYAIIQTAYIPDELYKRVHDFCRKLLTYPNPYCNVGYSYTKQIKSERSVPGLLYQRMLTAEQRLKNDHYPFQERIFVLADPDIFSGSLGEFLLDNTEVYASASGGSLDLIDHMCNVVLHSIQAALGTTQCHGQQLAKALKDMGQDVQPYFHKVLWLLEQCLEEGSRIEGGALKGHLLQLYREIIGATNSEPLSGGPLCSCPIPNPDMKFYLLKDFDIKKELAHWLPHSSTSQEHEDSVLGEPPTDMLASDITRLSVMSNDSGIERDLPPSSDDPSSSLENVFMSPSWEQAKSETSPSPSESESSRLSRRGGIKMKLNMKDGMKLMQESFDDPTSLGGGSGERRESRGATLQRRAGSNTIQSPFPKQQRLFTAKIVAMGDDRILGRLAKEYYSYKKREIRRFFPTVKVNVQFYYIPVSSAMNPRSSVKETLGNSKGNPCTLGSYLSMVDPWYNTNIKSLGSMIPKLAAVANPGTSKDPFVSDVISYYVRTGQQPIYFAIYSVKVIISNSMKPTIEDMFLTHLQIDFPDIKHISDGEKQKKSQAEFCGGLVLISYRKVTLSGRDVDIRTSIRISSAQINAIPSDEKEDLNCLTLTLNESPTKPKSNIVGSKYRTSNIKIETLTSRPVIVTLDGDNNRIYTEDVQSIEIAQCSDPLYNAHKTVRSKFNLGEDKDACLNKYMNKDLCLPINTFTGIIT